MTDHSLSITLTARATADEHDYVIIEQEPWGKDVGRTSVSQGIIGIGVMIFGESLFGGSIPLPNCGDADGIEAPVYVYPSRVDLDYIFRVSHGGPSNALVIDTPQEEDLSAGRFAGVINVVTREETLQCSFRDYVETAYPIKSWISTEWLGECFDSAGNSVGRPGLVRQGRKLFFDRKVYGSVRVKYSVYRVTYRVHINEREDSIENNFQSVAYCVWDGGIEYKDIQAPSGYELNGEDCGNGMPEGYNSSTETCPDDIGRGSRPVAVTADRLIEIDYCPQVETSDEITESVDTEREPGDECE